MTDFEGVLLKPLDQQHDRDGDHIDPAGVTFDPDEEYPIWRDFNYKLPDDMLGSGKISRAEDGSLVVKGTLVELGIDVTDIPWRLAIGVIVDDKREYVPGRVIGPSRLMSVAFTNNHADETQPPITIIRRDKE